MNDEKTLRKKTEDMREAIKNVNRCLAAYDSDENSKQLGEAMKQLKQSYKAIKSSTRGIYK